MKEWMAENCCIAFVDDKGPVALSDFTKFVAEQFGAEAGKTVFLDC